MALEDKIISALKGVYGFFRFVGFFSRNVKTIYSIPERESFYPEYPRKSNWKIRSENFKYLLKYHEVNPYYISYGFDAENFRNQQDFIPHMVFIKNRSKGNQTPKRTHTGDYNYITLLRDKYVFANYLSSAIGPEHTVPTLSLIVNQEAFKRDEQSWKTIDSLLAKDEKKVFKVIDGECADGVMLVEGKEKSFYVDDQLISRDDFLSLLKNKKIIVQSVVEQHEQLKRFKTRSVNTIRIVTIRGKSGKIGVFAAFLRLSGNAESFVDNRAKGGLGIGIDLETGKLMKYGFPHDGFGNKTPVHELSQIVFEGFQLPYWEDTKKLVIIAHKQFYEIQSIGWDVALTPDGPCLLEGNDDWEIGGPQDTCGGLKAKWDELVNG